MSIKDTEIAFAKIIADNQGIIHKVCNMYCDRPDDRQDLFQEIVLQLWRAYPSFKGQSKVSTWLYRVALNTAISAFRKHQKTSPQTRYFFRAVSVGR